MAIFKVFFLMVLFLVLGVVVLGISLVYRILAWFAPLRPPAQSSFHPARKEPMAPNDAAPVIEGEYVVLKRDKEDAP